MDEARRTAYGQYRPISRALEILGKRWALLIMRDLIVGATHFNDLARGLPGLSRSLLAKRLRQLERAGLVDHLGGQYLLTEAGRDLESVVFGLGQWGARWAFEDPHPASASTWRSAPTWPPSTRYGWVGCPWGGR